MSPTLLRILLSLLWLSLAPSRTFQGHELEYSIQSFRLVGKMLNKRNSEVECSVQELESILQGCEESVKPADTSVSTRFCGSMCKDRVADYAHTCNHANFSLNVTGTCLVNNFHPQCIFAVVLVRPGIVSCTATAITSEDEPSTVVADSSISQHCTLSSSYNTTGEHYRIEFDTTLMSPVIRPSLEPPWNNCCQYYDHFGVPPLVNDQKRTASPAPTIECSQSHLEGILHDCETAVMPTSTGESISRRFCGGSCRSQITAYAAACNATEFSINITGSCQTSISAAQCVFAVILIRPGISSCSATSVHSNETLPAVSANTLPCCLLHSAVNTTGDFLIIPDPQTGLPVINPPLVPPWESCSAYTESIEYSCEETTTPTFGTPTSTEVEYENKTVPSIFTSSSSTSSLHEAKHVYLLIFVFLINML